MIKGIIYFLVTVIVFEVFLVCFYLYQSEHLVSKVRKKVTFIEKMVKKYDSEQNMSVKKMARRLTFWSKSSKLNWIAIVLFVKENDYYFQKFELDRHATSLNDSDIYSYVSKQLFSKKNYQKAYGIWLSRKLNLRFFISHIIECFTVPNGVVQFHVIKALISFGFQKSEVLRLIDENKSLVLAKSTITQLVYENKPKREEEDYAP